MTHLKVKLWLPPELTKYKMFASFVPVLDSFHWYRINKCRFLQMLSPPLTLSKMNFKWPVKVDGVFFSFIVNFRTVWFKVM